jgi:hypothetical protein
MEGIEWTKIKYTHSRDTSLNINLNINNERQDCKICTVYLYVGDTSRRREGEWRLR